MNKLNHFYRSFTGRMVLAALLMHALLVPFLTFGIHRIIVQDIKDEFINYARAQSRQFGIVLEDKPTRAAVQAMLQDWLVSGQVAFAELISEQGESIRAHYPNEKGSLTFIEDFGFGEHGDDQYFVSVPVRPVSNELRGMLHIGFDETPMQERIRMLYRRGVLLILGYLAASLLLAWGAGNVLGRSIRQLRDAARSVAVGDRNEVLDIQTQIAEVSSLTQDLEFMRKELVGRSQELQELAYFDSLTGLANRLLFSQRLTAALGLARRNNRKLAILYLDLDRFKRVNDTLGHGAGDELLRGVAHRLQECLRKSDLVASVASESALDSIARLGGDEFTILLPDIPHIGAVEAVAHRILNALCQPIPVGDHQVYATASMGIALYPIDGEDPATLLKNADAAMYHAKQHGKNRFQYYTDSMNMVAAATLQLESALHRAIELDQLVLHYQPQVDVQTGKLVGAEALVRWQHPQRGLLAPDDFIPLAEECGLIIPIGEWVLRRACAQLRSWQEQALPVVRISVNVSALQFQQSAFIQTVVGALRESKVAPGMLALEITETTLMAYEEEAIGRLQELRALGVGLSIDDFGTGYSSLAYLKQFSVQALKIDQSFLQDVPQNPHNAAIIQAIIALAKSLGLNVIAEGAETRQQWQFLAEQGCKEMQGYLISRPLAAEDFEEFLKSDALVTGYLSVSP
jgi:diguanylate cyclase (GGDEF)-like protein